MMEEDVFKGSQSYTFLEGIRSQNFYNYLSDTLRADFIKDPSQTDYPYNVLNDGRLYKKATTPSTSLSELNMLESFSNDISSKVLINSKDNCRHFNQFKR